jgi:uncharacterized protein YjiS (DUF1127 family)
MFAISKEDRVQQRLYQSTRTSRAWNPKTKAALSRAAPWRPERIPEATLWQAFPHRLTGFLSGVGAVLREWRRRRNGRLELARLDERMLRDIGLTHADAEYEMNKPFWRE